MEMMLFMHGVLLLVLFAAVTLLVYSIFRVRLEPEPAVNRRVALALGVGERSTVFEMPGVRQLLLANLLLARRFPLFRDRIRRDLEASGNPSGYTVEEYVALCLAVGEIMLIVGLFSAGLFGVFGLMVAIFLGIIGFYGPMWAIADAAHRRTTRIAKRVPYTLDLIALMMEAGGTFTEAIETLIRDEPEDDFNQELRLVQTEIEFGTPRSGALANLAQRIPLESLRGVVGAINQSEALGTPLSTILKNQASMLRHLRSVRAEEMAAKASLRILAPGVLILIAVILVVFAPIILAWNDSGGILPQ
jgi:tight adherence protein C